MRYYYPLCIIGHEAAEHIGVEIISEGGILFSCTPIISQINSN